MAKDRMDAGRGRRKKGVVKSSKASNTTRIFYLAIAVVAIGGIGALSYLSTRRSAAAEASPVDTTLPKIESQGYVTGSPDAPIEVIEFGDFECPACENFATLTKPDVQSQLVNSGKIRFRFVDFPLPGHHNTWDASRAAACGDEQGKFWQLHDLIYANQDRWWSQETRNPSKVIKELARQVPGLDYQKFDDCVDSKRMQAKVQAHLALAQQYQVSSTPTFIIGGKKYPGTLPFDEMRKLVDEAIAAAPRGGGGDTATKKAPTP